MPAPDDDEANWDQAIEDSFPASDPPARSGIVGPRLRHPQRDAAQPAKRGKPPEKKESDR